MRSLLAATALTLFAAAPATAATFTVTTTNNAGAGSLRAAVDAADTTTTHDDIVLPTGTIVLAGKIVVDESVTIKGNGSGASVVSGGNTDIVFDLATGVTLELIDLAVVDGFGGGTPGVAVRTAFGNGAAADHVVLTRTRIAGHRSGSAVHVQGEGTTAVTDSVFENNGGSPATTSAGGAIWLEDDSGGTIVRSTFRENHVTDDGGAINVWNKAEMSVTDSIFDRNSAGDDGGAINLWNDSVTTIAGTSITNATAGGDGGAINVWNNARLTMSRSSLTDNRADANGGAINQWNATTLDLADSTVSENTAGANGGAFFAWNSAVTNLVNTTVDDNTATARGGAFFHQNTPTLTTLHATVSDNKAGEGGVLYNNAAAGVHVRFQNTVLSQNTASTGPAGCAHGAGSSAASLASSGHNVESGDTCSLTGTGDKPASDAKLGPLQDNGGPTETRGLLDGSAARNLVPPSAGCPAADQRGTARPQEGVCDAGAFEAVPSPPPLPPAAVAPAPPAAVVPLPPRPVVARLAALKASQVLTLPSARRCVSRRSFRIRLKTPRGARITRVVVKVNNKRVRTVRGRRITAPVNLRGLPRGRFTVSIEVATADGRKVTAKRRYRTCAPRKRR